MRGLAEAGADVALLYSTSTNATDTAQEIAAKTGARVRAYQSDVRSRTAISATVEKVVADFGGLDIMVRELGRLRRDSGSGIHEDLAGG